MPHDEFWLVQEPEHGTVYGQCTTCGWTTTRHPNTGTIPDQLTLERLRHGERPDAPTLDLQAAGVTLCPLPGAQ